MNQRWCIAMLVLFASAVVAQVPADLKLTQFGTATFAYPLALRSPRDGSGRLFVIEQGGTVHVLGKTGALLGTYITVPVTSPSPGGNEQGLLGMAFDPNFGRNPAKPGYGDFYLAFTAPGSDPKLGDAPDQLVRRYTVSDPTSNDASAATSVDVIRIPDLYSNHNGGDIHFGPDGYLYYGMGDGGSGGDPNGFAQCLWKKTDDATPANCGSVPTGKHAYYLLGKMMRLDVHHTMLAPAPANMCGDPTGAAVQYAIPSDNPYAAATNQCAEIWLYGLRNPYRWSFDRSTGDQWIGDVGQGAYEEVDLRAAGSSDSRNYGWNLCEGSHAYPSGVAGCPAATAMTAPVLEYDHTNRCAIIGGFRYRGQIGAFDGTYAFSDVCSGQIYLMHKGSAASTCPAGFNTIAGSWVCTLFAPSTGSGTVSSASGFGEDELGSLYVTGVTAQGAVYKFTSADAIFANSFDW